MMMTTELDKANTLEATHSALAVSLSGHGNHSCPDLRAFHLFILKAFFITSVLGWLFSACPPAVADDAYTVGSSPDIDSQPQAGHMLNLSWQAFSVSQYNFSWQRQNVDEYRSVDGLHIGVQRLRQILSTLWASKTTQFPITERVKSLIAATGDGPYAAWSYNIGASSKALKINIRYAL